MDQQPPLQCLAGPCQVLYCLKRHHGSQNARQRGNHASLGAGRCKARGGTVGENTFKTRPAIRGMVQADLPFPLCDRRRNQRFATGHRRSVDQIARIEIIGPVQYQVIIGKQGLRDIIA